MVPLSEELAGQTALVSGSSRGIGKGIARALLQAGARVYLNGRDAAALTTCADELRTVTGRDSVQTLCADLTHTEVIADTLSLIAAESGGGPHIVVANIGSGRSAPGWDIDDDEWERMLEVNLLGAVRLCRGAVRCMAARGGGNLVVVSSIAGCEAIGAPTPYAAAKAGLLAFVKATADQVAEHGIRVNAVCPGNVMFEGSTWDRKLAADRDGVMAAIRKKVPMNGFATPEDIGQMVAFLVSERARFITGANLVVDGGQLRSFA
jgi:3-oxoacyl-[acyl-carrier protein] reductase